jgi:hypothetical protein
MYHLSSIIHHLRFIIHPYPLYSSIIHQLPSVIHFDAHLYQSCALVRGSCLCRRRGARVAVASDVRSLARSPLSSGIRAQLWML